ncbi:MAG: type II/IV secretion system ATPase subunit [Candidatus Nezhaarchaeales archaeon]
MLKLKKPRSNENAKDEGKEKKLPAEIPLEVFSEKAPCQLLSQLEPSFAKVVEKHPHLHKHLHDFLDSQNLLGVPMYSEKLTREMGRTKKYNYIYPIGNGIFVHVYKTQQEAYGTYQPIEPRLPEEVRELIFKVEELIALRIDDNYAEKIETARQEALMAIFDEVVKKDEGAPKNAVLYRKNAISLGSYAYEYVRYEFIREKVGLGILEPFLKDPYIEDISCDGLGPIFVEHKVFRSLKATIEFRSQENLNSFIVRLCERIGRPVSPRRPIVDASLPDGSRINVVYGVDVSRRGSNFTIRKFSSTPLSITQLIKYGTMTAQMAAYLWMLLEAGMSIFVCGETASGKTTTLNALAVFIKPTAKVITIEDTPEVVVPHPNWISEVTRKGESESSSIELYDLLKAALRQRPNYIIVGEIRGREGNVAFQAMQTGHPVMATFHAADMQKLIQRITGDPINIPPAYIDNLNAVVFQNAVESPRTGQRERRVTSICEIVGIDPVEKTYNFIEIFSWDPATDTHSFRGVGNSYLLEYKIAPTRGLSAKDARKIYGELEARTYILQKMVEEGIFDYWDVYRVISKIYASPILANIAYGKSSFKVIDKLIREV